MSCPGPDRPKGEQRPRIIVLTNSAKTEDLHRSLTKGAKAYLLKGSQPRQVWDTIREVYAGKSSLPHDVAAQLAAWNMPKFHGVEKRNLGADPRGLRSELETLAGKDARIDAGFAPWRSEAIARGYVSCVALPLIAGENRVGNLSLYSGEANAFKREYY